ncbi:MAG: hypothetical protein FWC61_01705 [Proteobacteria bacterium]|nr:hypothetical protein [Pseudomonadota bacterium]
MKERPAIVAQRLLNLYRQAHVIAGGWPAVNPIFVSDSDSSVIAELKKLPTGGKLAQHIANLQTGKTPMNSIDRELMPYGGAMFVPSAESEKFSDGEVGELERALNKFAPDEDHLKEIKELGAVKKFGDDWLAGVGFALSSRPDLAEKWKIVQQTVRAYDLWSTANNILSSPVAERERARVQADLPEYETYLPMFGDAGKELLSKLRAAVSTV